MAERILSALAELRIKDGEWLKKTFSMLELREISTSAVLQKDYIDILRESRNDELRAVKILLYRFIELRTCLIRTPDDVFKEMFGTDKHDYAFQAYNLSADLVNEYIEAKRLL